MSTPAQHLDHLNAHLDAHPGDRDARRVLADLLEETGDQAGADFERWLAAQGLWPDDDLAPYSQAGWWHWWSCPDLPARRRAHAVVPDELLARMPAGEWVFRTRREAEQALRGARDDPASRPRGPGRRA